MEVQPAHHTLHGDPRPAVDGGHTQGVEWVKRQPHVYCSVRPRAGPGRREMKVSPSLKTQENQVLPKRKVPLALPQKRDRQYC